MEISDNFGVWDVIVLMAFFGGVTYLGHRLGKSTTTRQSFFTADGTMPWWAVSTSHVATNTSALTFIAVPAAVFMDGGDLTYLQVLFGLIVGDLMIAFILSKPYYNSKATTVIDFIATGIDRASANLSLILHLSLGWISASLRLLATALVLSVITHWSIGLCVFIMMAFAIVWSWMAGIKTVIWTDFILYGAFTLGAFFAMGWMWFSVDLPLPQWIEVLDEKAKLAIFDLSLDKTKSYTLWTALLGASLLEFGSATGQAVMQRIKSCRSAEDARKAYVCIGLFSLSPYFMLTVGLGLVVFYHMHGLPLEFAQTVRAEPDRIFPYFIVNELPTGVSGLFVAAIFSAGVSTLDSQVTATADLTVTNVYERYLVKGRTDRHYLVASKLAVVFWGLVFASFALVFSSQQEKGLLQLAFKLPGYVSGALTGTVILAVLGVGRWQLYLVGLAVSMTLVVVFQMHGFAFFWWYSVGALGMLVTVLAGERLFPGKGEAQAGRLAGSRV